MYEKGKTNSFDELLGRFITFVSKQDTANTNPWQMLKYDTNHSFYGTTVKVPLPKYKTKDNRIPCFYITFQHSKIKETTYSNWLRTSEAPEYEAFGYGQRPRPFNAEYYAVDEHSSPSFGRVANNNILTKYGKANQENPFVEPGEFIAVGLHTLYDERLWMCEQGGITCEEETQNQRNTINLLRARGQTTGALSGEEYIDLPRFPGTGCPWITMTEKNSDTYSVKEGNLEYWFTKDDYSATITIKFSRTGLQDIYQSISFGMMETFQDDNYRFPLFVAGGNQALREDYWTFNPLSSRYPDVIGANSYDLDITNPALSNNTLLHPCKFNGSNISNFKVLAPDGRWRNIWNVEQTATIQNYYSCGTIYEWGQVLGGPTFEIGKKADTTFPWATENRYHNDSHTVIQGADKNKRGGLTQDILVVFNKEDVGVKGKIPNAAFCWSRNIPAGEIKIGDKLFLAVPCGWESRLWDYKGQVGLANDPKFWDTRKLSELQTTNMEKNGINKMVSRLLIRLE